MQNNILFGWKPVILICVLTLVGCMANTSSLETHQQTARTDPGLINKYHPPQSALEEYVNRIGKRVVLVSDRPSTNYIFNVTSDGDAILSIDHETHTIIVSEGLLHQLHDEAELAATLSLAIGRLSHSADINRYVANNLVRAGYDPRALLDLQQQYFSSGTKNQQHWLSSIYNTPPSAGTITATKTMLQKMPPGLLRGAEVFNKQING